MNSGHSYFNINHHIDMKSSLSENLKSFLYETRAKSDARCYFRAIIWGYSQSLHVLLPWTQVGFWPFTPLDVGQLPIFFTFLAFIHIREPPHRAPESEKLKINSPDSSFCILSPWHPTESPGSKIKKFYALGCVIFCDLANNMP